MKRRAHDARKAGGRGVAAAGSLRSIQFGPCGWPSRLWYVEAIADNGQEYRLYFTDRATAIGSYKAMRVSNARIRARARATR